MLGANIDIAQAMETNTKYFNLSYTQSIDSATFSENLIKFVIRILKINIKLQPKQQ